MVFNTIATHVRPDLDEIGAMWLLQSKRFGAEKIFPGISTAKLVIWRNGKSSDGRSAEELEKDGILAIGVAGGWSDEHPTKNKVRTRQECTMTLVAKKLGVENDPTLQSILKYVLWEDTHGGGRSELAGLVKTLHAQYPDSLEQVIWWTTIALEGKYQERKNSKSLHGDSIDGCSLAVIAETLGIDGSTEKDDAIEAITEFISGGDNGRSCSEFSLLGLARSLYCQYPEATTDVIAWGAVALGAIYKHQQMFWTSAKEEFENAEVEEITHLRGQTIKVATLVSDSEQVATFARSKKGGGVAVLILKRSSGHVSILTNRKSEIELYDVAQMVRREEQEAKGKVVTSSWQLLSGENSVPGAEEWYFHIASQCLMNGSPKHPDVPSTRLSMERIKELVIIGLSNVFESTRDDKCFEGVCTSPSHNRCPWYKWGLLRCRMIRRMKAS